jgi:hypothetical protein
LPPAVDCVKGNFDVAVKDSFVVAAAFISDEKGTIIATVTLKFHLLDRGVQAVTVSGYWLKPLTATG